MPVSPNTINVHHLEAESRFEADVAGQRAVLDYVRREQEVVMTRTFVPPEIRGRGVAEQLVRAALAWAQAEGLRVVPACSYVARFVARHAEYRSLLGPS